MLFRLAALVLLGLLLAACSSGAGESDQGPWPIIVVDGPVETLVNDEFDRTSLVYPGALEASEGAGEDLLLYSTGDEFDTVVSYYQELGIALTDVDGVSHVAIVRGGGHVIHLMVREESELVVIQLFDINLAEAARGSQP